MGRGVRGSLPAPISLRPLREEDLVRLVAWGDDPQVELHFGKPFGSPAELERLLMQTRHGRRLSMAIVLGSDAVIGLVEVANICWRNRSGELSVFIGEETNRGHGFGTAAVALFLDDIFSGGGLERVYLRVARHNVRARRCYEKCGFRARAMLGISRRQPSRADELLLMELDRPTWARKTAGGQPQVGHR